MGKDELEFCDTRDFAWRRCDGPVDGLMERILSVDAQTGVATRLLRFDEGTDTSPNGAQVHEFWEEVYILEGSLYDLTLDMEFCAGMYACRPPGMRHGPWIARRGCMTFEVRYV